VAIGHQRPPGRATGPTIVPRLADPGDLTAGGVSGAVVADLVAATVDYRAMQLQALTDAGGVATLTLPAPPTAQLYLVERILLRVDPAATMTEAELYVGEPRFENLADYVAGIPNIAVMADPVPILVPGGAELVVVIHTGAAAGVKCIANLQVRTARLVAVPTNVVVG
jgi:hypothetical protein